MLNVGNWLSPCRRLGVSPLVRPPIFDKLIQWACGSPKTLDDGTVIIEDKKGKSGLRAGREQIPSAYLDGDGSRYLNVPSITDANLPANYEIEWVGLYRDAAGLTGFFGFDSNSTTGLFLSSRGTGDNRFTLRVGTTAVNGTISSTDGEFFEIRLVKSGDDYEVFANGLSIISTTATRSITSKSLQLLTLGDASSISSHDCYTFRITNTDTGEDLVKYNFQDSNANTFCYDASGNDNHGEIQNATGADRVESDNIAIGDMDSNGYTLARALGKNLLNETNSLTGRALLSGLNYFNNVSNSTRVLSGLFAITEGKTYVRNTVNTAKTIFFDENYDQTFYSGKNSTTVHTAPTGSVWGCIEYDTTEPNIGSLQVEEGDTPTTYEAWDGYYRDNAQADPVSDGERSPNVNGFSVWYDSNGDRAVSQFTGLLKADLYYNKGNFDSDQTTNYLDTGIIPNETTEMDLYIKPLNNSVSQSFGGSRVAFQNDEFRVGVAATGQIYGGYGTNFSSSLGSLSLSEQILSIKNGNIFRNDVQLSSFTASLVSPTRPIYLMAYNSGAVAERADALYYKVIIKHDGSIYVWDFNADGDETVKYTIDGVEQTSPTIQGTVTSPQWSDDAIAQQATNRYDLIQADDLTTTDMYDTTDVDNAEALVVPLTGDVQDNPLFIAEDPFCWLLYNETLTTEENEAVDKYLGFSAPLLDGASDFLLDGGDNQITGTPQ